MGSHIEAGTGFGNGRLALSAGGAAGSAPLEGLLVVWVVPLEVPLMGGAAGRAPAGAWWCPWRCP